MSRNSHIDNLAEREIKVLTIAAAIKSIALPSITHVLNMFLVSLLVKKCALISQKNDYCSERSRGSNFRAHVCEFTLHQVKNLWLDKTIGT